MTIQVGDKIPEATLQTMGPNGPESINTRTFCRGRRVVIFGVPGAFTPGCTRNHLPDYVRNADAILSNGFDTIACTAVNDVWVMDAWGRAAGAPGKVKMLADGNAELTLRMGLQYDLTHAGMGIRCKRFSIVVNDGTIESLNVDERMIELTSASQTCKL